MAAVCRSSGASRTTCSYSLMAGASLPMRSSFWALRRTAVRSKVMGAAASGLGVGDITIQRIEVIHVGKQHSCINISQVQIRVENCALVAERLEVARFDYGGG